MNISFSRVSLFNSSLSNVKLAFMMGLSLSVAPLAPSALAEAMLDHPPLSPQKDVVVLYRFQVGKNVANSGHMKEVKVSFAASGDRLRIDQIDGPGVTILDRITKIVTLVNNTNQSYVEFTPQHGIHNPFMIDISMKYKPRSMMTIAGHTCREWDIDTKNGQQATVCVTDDGVILSEKGVDADGVTGMLEALSVSYQDIPASQFEAPEAFHKIMPHMVPLPPMPESSQNTQQDTSQPHVANDSPSDGTVQHADQPS